MDKKKLKKLEKLLENKKNFVGIGTGIQLKNKKPTGKKGILIGVSEKVSEDDLSPQDLMPKEIEGMETDVIDLSDLRELAGWRDKHRPMKLGASACHKDVTACSFGLPLFVKEIKEDAPKEIKEYFEIGDPCVMMNGHCGFPQGAEVGDDFVNPSPIDGTPERIGEASPIHFEKSFDNDDNLDTMVAKLDKRPLLEDVAGNDYEFETRRLNEDDLLKDVVGGSRTIQEVRTAIIISVDFRGRLNANIDGEDGVLKYEDCALVYNESKEGGPFVEGGCSSSVRFVDDKPLTQVFLGSATVGVMNQVQKSFDMIEDKFGVVFSLEPVEEPVEGYVAINPNWQGEEKSKVSLNVREEPGTSAEVLTTMHEGAEFKEIDNKYTFKDGYRWMKVKVLGV